jgi:hypothetical protein
VIAQAAGLAVIAAISPTALLVAAVYLGSARPRLIAAYYLAGATVMSIVMGLTLLFVLRSIDLNAPHQHAPRDGLRLGLGLVILTVGVLLFVIRRRPARSPDDRPGLVNRLIAAPTPRSAFLVGVLVFAPGASFLAALQVIATSRASPAATAIAIVIVVALNVMLVWLPIALFICAPELTTHWMSTFNGWLTRNGRSVLLVVFFVVGTILVVAGAYGLATRT